MPWYGSHRFLEEFIVGRGCRRLLEVGVYSGENAVCMVGAAARGVPVGEVEYYGFDFFRHYGRGVVAGRLAATGCRFRLFEGDTRVTLPAAVGGLPPMDVVFIDGGKSVEVAGSDWECCSGLMHGESGVFFHNVGYPGVRRVVEGIPADAYRVEVFREPGEGEVALVTLRE